MRKDVLLSFEPQPRARDSRGLGDPAKLLHKDNLAPVGVSARTPSIAQIKLLRPRSGVGAQPCDTMPGRSERCARRGDESLPDPLAFERRIDKQRPDAAVP